VGDQRQAPAALPPGKDPVTIIQEAEWAPGPVWTGAENLAPPPPPGFDPRTVQPVASRYTDYTIPTRDILTEVGKAAGTLTPPFNCRGYTASR
jgi:hypothetical protein